MTNISKFTGPLKRLVTRLLMLVRHNLYFGKSLSHVPDNSLVFFPFHENMLCCGLAGIVSVKRKNDSKKSIDVASLSDKIETIAAKTYIDCFQKNILQYTDYLGGQELISSFLQDVQKLKEDDLFIEIFLNETIQNDLNKLSHRLQMIIDNDSKLLVDQMGQLETQAVDIISERIEGLKDINWCLTTEIEDNLTRLQDLLGGKSQNRSAIKIFKKINTVLNSIDRLEVRGRDSAGISLMFVQASSEFEKFKEALNESEDSSLAIQFKERSDNDVLVNMNIRTNELLEQNGEKKVAVTFTYKIAAEIGSLGDNINFIRTQIKNDRLLHSFVTFAHHYHTVTSHTRWASVGAITVANCHPVDNVTKGTSTEKTGIIHACLNGDIDNYQEMKEQCEAEGTYIHEDITTDTKIIPLWIEKYLKNGFDFLEAFRLAVNDFEGSHAISVHSDFAPGKIFLAQKGSGQAIFIGLAPDHYMSTSEVYGFIEETPFYLKMDGEKVVEGKNGKTQGQIFILDQQSHGRLSGLKALYYDGTPIELEEKDIKYTAITSRDIDRQNYPHYFLKEISESPVSVEKTLQNRWKINERGKHEIVLDEKVFPQSLKKALVGSGHKEARIRRIFFMGQGTAGVAALACAEILNYYLSDPTIQISSLKASELSGFKLSDHDNSSNMTDALIIAITQSGTTTDTNRAVDMVKKRGAHTLAIVNRRDSDITFKADGVMYTSSGRDIEMSVASTKAFYSQIIAGAVISLYIAGQRGKRDDDFVSREIEKLREIPSHMRKVMAQQDKICASARRISATKKYWAAVGSGPNKASADEIRIKLSELCYKTISSDYVEDKKHIDLSSEPLIIVCAAGTRGTVIGDIIKDTAIFKAHKAAPIVIADEGEDRFTPHAVDVFHVPVVDQHLAPILNTLAGHLWGYYAALVINEGSKFLHTFREELQKTINDHAHNGLDTYEITLNETFRGQIATFYNEFRQKRFEKQFPLAITLASDLVLLFKYLSGKLPATDFEIDFSLKGTPINMLNTLFKYLGESINQMSRPVDAIKHQAKTVTVGTSRIRERLEGILFEALAQNSLKISQLTNDNIIVLKNLQDIISGIKGSISYAIDGLNPLGHPGEKTTIEIINKKGVLAPIPSRVETDTSLKGTKRIIVQQGNVYIGKGRKDDRSIVVIPAISDSPASPNKIAYLLLLNISFKDTIPLPAKIKALGGKYEHIKNIVLENSIVWDDNFIERIETSELFGLSAEKVGEQIAASQNA